MHHTSRRAKGTTPGSSDTTTKKPTKLSQRIQRTRNITTSLRNAVTDPSQIDNSAVVSSSPVSVHHRGMAMKKRKTGGGGGGSHRSSKSHNTRQHDYDGGMDPFMAMFSDTLGGGKRGNGGGGQAFHFEFEDFGQSLGGGGGKRRSGNGHYRSQDLGNLAAGLGLSMDSFDYNGGPGGGGSVRGKRGKSRGGARNASRQDKMYETHRIHFDDDAYFDDDDSDDMFSFGPEVIMHGFDGAHAFSHAGPDLHDILMGGSNHSEFDKARSRREVQQESQQRERELKKQRAYRTPEGVDVFTNGSHKRFVNTADNPARDYDSDDDDENEAYMNGKRTINDYDSDIDPADIDPITMLFMNPDEIRRKKRKQQKEKEKKAQAASSSKSTVPKAANGEPEYDLSNVQEAVVMDIEDIRREEATAAAMRAIKQQRHAEQQLQHDQTIMTSNGPVTKHTTQHTTTVESQYSYDYNGSDDDDDNVNNTNTSTKLSPSHHHHTSSSNRETGPLTRFFSSDQTTTTTKTTTVSSSSPQPSVFVDQDGNTIEGPKIETARDSTTASVAQRDQDRIKALNQSKSERIHVKSPLLQSFLDDAEEKIIETKLKAQYQQQEKEMKEKQAREMKDKMDTMSSRYNNLSDAMGTMGDHITRQHNKGIESIDTQDLLDLANRRLNSKPSETGAFSNLSRFSMDVNTINDTNINNNTNKYYDVETKDDIIEFIVKAEKDGKLSPQEINNIVLKQRAIVREKRAQRKIDALQKQAQDKAYSDSVGGIKDAHITDEKKQSSSSSMSNDAKWKAHLSSSSSSSSSASHNNKDSSKRGWAGYTDADPMSQQTRRQRARKNHSPPGAGANLMDEWDQEFMRDMIEWSGDDDDDNNNNNGHTITGKKQRELTPDEFFVDDPKSIARSKALKAKNNAAKRIRGRLDDDNDTVSETWNNDDGVGHLESQFGLSPDSLGGTSKRTGRYATPRDIRADSRHIKDLLRPKQGERSYSTATATAIIPSRPYSVALQSTVDALKLDVDLSQNNNNSMNSSGPISIQRALSALFAKRNTRIFSSSSASTLSSSLHHNMSISLNPHRTIEPQSELYQAIQRSFSSRARRQFERASPAKLPRSASEHLENPVFDNGNDDNNNKSTSIVGQLSKMGNQTQKQKLAQEKKDLLSLSMKKTMEQPELFMPSKQGQKAMRDAKLKNKGKFKEKHVPSQHHLPSNITHALRTVRNTDGINAVERAKLVKQQLQSQSRDVVASLGSYYPTTIDEAYTISEHARNPKVPAWLMSLDDPFMLNTFLPGQDINTVLSASQLRPIGYDDDQTYQSIPSAPRSSSSSSSHNKENIRRNNQHFLLGNDEIADDDDLAAISTELQSRGWEVQDDVEFDASPLGFVRGEAEEHLQEDEERSLSSILLKAMIQEKLDKEAEEVQIRAADARKNDDASQTSTTKTDDDGDNDDDESNSNDENNNSNSDNYDHHHHQSTPRHVVSQRSQTGPKPVASSHILSVLDQIDQDDMISGTAPNTHHQHVIHQSDKHTKHTDNILYTHQRSNLVTPSSSSQRHKHHHHGDVTAGEDELEAAMRDLLDSEGVPLSGSDNDTDNTNTTTDSYGSDIRAHHSPRRHYNDDDTTTDNDPIVKKLPLKAGLSRPEHIAKSLSNPDHSLLTDDDDDDDNDIRHHPKHSPQSSKKNKISLDTLDDAALDDIMSDYEDDYFTGSDLDDDDSKHRNKHSNTKGNNNRDDDNDDDDNHDVTPMNKGRAAWIAQTKKQKEIEQLQHQALINAGLTSPELSKHSASSSSSNAVGSRHMASVLGEELDYRLTGASTVFSNDVEVLYRQYKEKQKLNEQKAKIDREKRAERLAAQGKTLSDVEYNYDDDYSDNDKPSHKYDKEYIFTPRVHKGHRFSKNKKIDDDDDEYNDDDNDGDSNNEGSQYDDDNNNDVQYDTYSSIETDYDSGYDDDDDDNANQDHDDDVKEYLGMTDEQRSARYSKGELADIVSRLKRNERMDKIDAREKRSTNNLYLPRKYLKLHQQGKYTQKSSRRSSIELLDEQYAIEKEWERDVEQFYDSAELLQQYGATDVSAQAVSDKQLKRYKDIAAKTKPAKRVRSIADDDYDAEVGEPQYDDDDSDIDHYLEKPSLSARRGVAKMVGGETVQNWAMMETELSERFVRGSGPGGQAINKTKNCVFLQHVPTGTIVKCQQTRDLATNRAIARKIMRRKLEVLAAGKDSYIGRKIERLRKKKQRTQRRQRSSTNNLDDKIAKLKAKLGIVDNTTTATTTTNNDDVPTRKTNKM